MKLGLARGLAVVGMLLATIGARPADAGILTGVDILNITDVTESSLTASDMTEARSVLTGAGATITDVAIGSFSAASLAGIDILYVGLSNGGFSASQLSAITSYVAAGGGLVAVGTERDCCYGPGWEQIASSFGLTGLGGDRPADATPSAPGSPIVTGPFGTATTYAPAATGAFSPVVPTGTTVVWEGVDGNPIIVTLDVTGRAFFFADTNFMQDPYIGNGDNRTIWGNAFAFTAAVAVPAPAPLGLMLVGLAGLMVARRRRQDA